MPRRTINLDDQTDRWRYRCPAGHVAWEPTNQHYFCTVCSRSHDPNHDPSFEELRDVKSGELLAREDVRLDGYEDTLRHYGKADD